MSESRRELLEHNEFVGAIKFGGKAGIAKIINAINGATLEFLNKKSLQHKMTPLVAAVDALLPEVVDALIKKEVKVVGKNDEPLISTLVDTFHCPEQEDQFWKIVRILIAYDNTQVNYQCPSKYNDSLLHMAVIKNRVDDVRFLSTIPGVNLNPKNTGDHTPAYDVVRCGEFNESVKILCENGADLTHIPNPDRLGNPILCSFPISSVKNPYSLLAQLIQYGADAHQRNRDSILLYAIDIDQNYFLDVWKLLLSQGLNVNVRGIWGKTLLHWAVSDKKWWLIPILLSAGVDPNVKNIYHRTALYDLENSSAQCPDNIRELLKTATSNTAENSAYKELTDKLSNCYEKSEVEQALKLVRDHHAVIKDVNDVHDVAGYLPKEVRAIFVKDHYDKIKNGYDIEYINHNLGPRQQVRFVMDNINKCKTDVELHEVLLSITDLTTRFMCAKSFVSKFSTFDYARKYKFGFTTKQLNVLATHYQLAKEIKNNSGSANGFCGKFFPSYPSPQPSSGEQQTYNETHNKMN